MSINENNELNIFIRVLKKAQMKLESSHSKTIQLLLMYLQDSNGVEAVNGFLDRLKTNTLSNADKERIMAIFCPAETIGRREAVIGTAGFVAITTGLTSFGIGTIHLGKSIKAAAPADKQAHEQKAYIYGGVGMGLAVTGAVLEGFSQKLHKYYRQQIIDSPEFEAIVKELVQSVTPVLDACAQDRKQNPRYGP